MASNVELAEATASDGAASLLRKATVRADMPRDICTIVSCIGNPVVCGMQQLHLHSVDLQQKIHDDRASWGSPPQVQ